MLAVIPLPGVNVIPFAQGKSSEVIPIALGIVATRFEAATPPRVAVSFIDPALDPATWPVTQTTPSRARLQDRRRRDVQSSRYGCRKIIDRKWGRRPDVVALKGAHATALLFRSLASCFLLNR
jgi:hypothetical protein